MTPYSSATELRALIAGGRVSAAELRTEQEQRIDRLNPALNAIVARAPVRAGDAGSARPPTTDALAGVPVTIKDTVEVAGWATTAGDPDRRLAVAEATAPAARRLLEAGGALVGKTNVPLAAGDWQTDNALYGRTVNPWDPERTPGGSTGGGAAAVAAGLSALELGSDIGGSIRVPAAFCGLFGHRPSEDLYPSGGQVPAHAAMCVLGPLARSAADLGLATGVLNGRPLPAPRATELSGLRVAVLPWAGWLPVDPEIAAALEAIAARLPHAGTAAPEGFDLWAHEELFAALLAAVTWAGLDGPARERVAAAVRAAPEPLAPAILRGLRAPDAAELLAERRPHQARWSDFFTRYDLLLTPVTLVNAFPHTTGPFLRRRLEPGGVHYKRLEVYPGLAALSGLPCTAFPSGRLSAGGLPIGLQVMGAAGDDATTLRFAQLAERELGCVFQPPPIA